jgi:hypothetical protein
VQNRFSETYLPLAVSKPLKIKVGNVVEDADADADAPIVCPIMGDVSCEHHVVRIDGEDLPAVSIVGVAILGTVVYLRDLGKRRGADPSALRADAKAWGSLCGEVGRAMRLAKHASRPASM